MVGVLIVSHGALAQELLRAAAKISGCSDFEALALSWEDSGEDVYRQVEEAIDRLLEEADGVLVLTDIFGGTPSNTVCRFAQTGRVAVVSGVNLPMVVSLGCMHSRNIPVDELAEKIREKGRSSICTGPSVRAFPGKVIGAAGN